ncbi:endolysin [Streptomyces phage Rowa]|uniref:Tape measure protein n=1 Tax=Streptomyces phage Rowa TaxID=2059883 RepID=A0A2H5BLS1_9CAUD|nr:endolysin [Streptomyces phage Rowa]AUG87279.1 tape measure protein [Streptomyces phage Rowa]
MANSPEIAVAYVSIVPEIQGFARQLREQIVGPAGDAGADAGNAAGEEMSGSLKDKLKAGAAIAAVAAGAVLAKGLTDAFEQASVTKKMQAQLGATGKEAEKYGKIAGKLYTSGVVDNFQEGADAIKAAMQSGIAPPGATNAQLQEIATKASDVAKTFDQDLGGVTNAVSQMMRTGLAKSSDEAFDILTKGFQSGANKADDLLDTMNEYGTQFRKMGLDGSTAMGLINQAIAGGARDADIAADAIKEFSIRAVDGSQTTIDGFKALGLNADDMAKKFGAGGKSASGALDLTLDRLRAIKDPVERNAAAVNLFGTQAEDLGDALFKMDPSAAATKLGEVGGAADRMGKTLRNGPMHELQVFTRELQQGLVSVMGTYVIPAIKTGADIFLTYLVPAFSSALKFASDWSPVLTGLAVLIGGLTLAVKAAAIQTAIFNGVTKVTTFFTNAWAVAQGILNAVMALNPFVLVAIALAALVAGIVVAYNKSETFRKIVQTAFKAVGDAGMWLWNNALKPAFTWIGDKAVWLWKNIIKPYFTFMVNYWKTVGGVAKSLYSDYIKPVFDWIADKAKWLWNKGVKPAFDSLKKGVGLVGDAFGKAKDAVKTAWDKLESIAKKPISFIINTVYNKGIVGVWNKVAGAFGAPKLDEFHPKGFARGGILPGMSSWRQGDDQLVPMRKGEGVYVSEAMRDPYERARLFAVNRAAMRGESLAKFREPGFAKGGVVGEGFAKGGIFGWIGNALQGAGSAAWEKIKKGASWLGDTLESSARAGVKHVVDPLLRKIPGSSTMFGKAVRGIPNKIIDSIFGYSKEADKRVEATGVGGKGTRQALTWAKRQAGKPYIWGGVGPKGFDCSGFMSAIQNVIMGKPANRRVWATGAFSGANAPGGWVRGMKAPFMVGITNAGVGHTAGTLNGVNVESRGGDGVVVGSRARSYRDALFTDWYGFKPSKKYDNGGWLMPGARMTANETGKPEPVFTASQWSVLSTLAARGAEASSGGLQDGARIVLVTEGGTFEAYVDQRADKRIETGLTGPAALGRAL